MPNGSFRNRSSRTPEHGAGAPAVTGDGVKGRVLFVTSTFPRWAGDCTAPFVLHLAQDVQALGWQVDVLAPHAPGARAREVIGGIGVARFRYLWPSSLETVCYGGGALVNLRHRPADVFKLPALVAAEAAAVAWRLVDRRYDLLHSHWILPQGFVGAISAGPLGIPHVVTVHGSDIFALRGPWLDRCKRFALRGASTVTVNSRATGEAVGALASGLPEAHRIPMGASETPADPEAVAAMRSRYRRGGGPLLAFAGRLIEEKGVADLLHAMALLGPGLSNLRAVVAGEGPERPRLERLARDLGIAERIDFVGWLEPPMVAPLMAAADIYVGPSRRGRDGTTEAQGLVFVEALLTGTPVVATRLGGIVDAIRHEDTGLLVDEAAPDQIAAAVARLAANPDLAERLAKNGRRLARRTYTRAASAEAFADVYAGLTAASGQPGRATRGRLTAGV